MNEKNQDTVRFEKSAQTPPKKKKGMSKKRANQQFMRTFLYALFVMGASLLLSLYGIQVANDALALIAPSGDLEVDVEKGSSLNDISIILKDSGIIDHRWAFKLFARLTGNDSSFQYGTYSLNTDMDYLELVTLLQRTATFQETVTVMFPEGLELREIVNRLVENEVVDEEEMYEALATYEGEYDYLQGLPDRENWLEGYMFPDTYQFFTNSDPEVVIEKFLNNFDAKWTDEFTARSEELDMTIDEVVTLASIIEREAVGSSDRSIVSSVFHNRLNSQSMTLLQSCATVQYVLQERKPVLTYDDIAIESLYNTYIHAGLPVGPIASPGLASIEAALYPDETDYYYFVVSSSGEHIFSTTLGEHESAIRQANTSQGTGAVTQ